MHAKAISRPLGLMALAALLAACSQNTQTAAGQTPVPSNTTLAQANSTAAPEQALSSGPGQKFIARTGATVKGVTFEVWANGRPIGTISWPNKALDVTEGMRGHANVLVIRWTRTQKNGMGTMAIQSQTGKKIVSASVTPSSPAKGQVSKTIVAQQAPVGRPSSGP